MSEGGREGGREGAREGIREISKGCKGGQVEVEKGGRKYE